MENNVFPCSTYFDSNEVINDLIFGFRYKACFENLIYCIIQVEKSFTVLSWINYMKIGFLYFD